MIIKDTGKFHKHLERCDAKMFSCNECIKESCKESFVIKLHAQKSYDQRIEFTSSRRLPVMPDAGNIEVWSHQEEGPGVCSIKDGSKNAREEA